jgi:hypothetical protein
MKKGHHLVGIRGADIIIKELDGRRDLVINDGVVSDGGTESGEHIIGKKFFSAPDIFDSAAKHIKSEHVEKDMHESAGVMHKHVGNDLIEPEFFRPEIMEPEHIGEVQSLPQKKLGGEIEDDVDDQQIFYYVW